jgi:hypothetical protein
VERASRSRRLDHALGWCRPDAKTPRAFSRGIHTRRRRPRARPTGGGRSCATVSRLREDASCGRAITVVDRRARRAAPTRVHHGAPPQTPRRPYRGSAPGPGALSKARARSREDAPAASMWDLGALRRTPSQRRTSRVQNPRRQRRRASVDAVIAWRFSLSIRVSSRVRPAPATLFLRACETAESSLPRSCPWASWPG